jgi:hypothetical protein
MYLGSWKIDDLLTFYANTTRFDTGAATDADSVPTYRVYEDETGTPLLTGSMALIDSANTAGFYSEQITLSAANGFEKGKCYSIYITATVNSVAGATHKTFQMEAEVDANVVSGGVNVTQISGDSTAADNAEAFFDGTGYAGTNNVIPTVTTATNVTTVNGLAAGVITATAIADNAIDLAALASDVKARLLASGSVTKMDLSAGTMLAGTVDNTAFTATTTILESDDITEATADHFNGRLIFFTSGALIYQATEITDYALNGGRGRFTYTAITEAPADNGTFIIV